MPDSIRAAFTNYLHQQIGLAEFNIATWERITDGWETDVYAYQLTTPKRTEDRVLRIFAGDSVAKARREYFGMSALDYLGYPVPKVNHLCEDSTVLGGAFILMERIFGQALGRVMSENPADAPVLLRRFIGLLVELHQLPAVPLHELVPDVLPITNLADFWVTKLAFARQYLIDQFQQTWAVPILDWLETHTPYFPPDAAPATLHNDFHPYNVLMTPDGHTRVIDWPNIEVGDFRYDLAWTIMLMTTYGGPSNRREAILAEYGNQSAQRIVDIEIFEVIAAARRLVDMVMTLGAGTATVGLLPETAATMRRQVGHFRAVYEILQQRSGLALPEIEMLLRQMGNGDNQPT